MPAAVHLVSNVVTPYLLRFFTKYGGDAMKAYRETVAYFHEGLPLGKGFATQDDTHWEQTELTSIKKIDQAGHITVPSDMDEVNENIKRNSQFMLFTLLVRAF